MAAPDYDAWLMSGPGGPNDDWPEDEDGHPLTEDEIEDNRQAREEDLAHWSEPW